MLPAVNHERILDEAADRAKQIARRKAIYLELHPETARGGDRRSDQTEKFSVRSFAEETAEKTGVTDRVVRLHAERGERRSLTARPA